MSFLDGLLTGLKQIQSAGMSLVPQPILNFIGANLYATNDGPNNRTNLQVIGVRPVINVRDPKYGAIGDGASHPLSSLYPTLAAAQAQYPFATSLTNEIDRCAIQLALTVASGSASTTCIEVAIPLGTYMIDSSLTFIGNVNIAVRIAGQSTGVTIGTVLRWNGPIGGRILQTYGLCHSEIDNVTFDANTTASPACVGLWLHTNQPAGGSASDAVFVTKCHFINFQSAKVSGNPNLTFTASGHTIARDSGSWLTDGFQAGDIVQIYASTSNNTASLAIQSISVDGLTLTMASGVTNEGPKQGVKVQTNGVGVNLGDPGTQQVSDVVFNGCAFVGNETNQSTWMFACVQNCQTGAGNTEAFHFRGVCEFSAASFGYCGPFTNNGLSFDAGCEWGNIAICNVFAPGSAQVRITGSQCENSFGGTMSGNPSVTFSGSAHTIVRGAGSWITDGFQVGNTVVSSGTTSNNGNLGVLTGVSASTLTFASGLTNEGPETGVSISSGKTGVFAITGGSAEIAGCEIVMDTTNNQTLSIPGFFTGVSGCILAVSRGSLIVRGCKVDPTATITATTAGCIQVTDAEPLSSGTCMVVVEGCPEFVNTNLTGGQIDVQDTSGNHLTWGVNSPGQSNRQNIYLRGNYGGPAGSQAPLPDLGGTPATVFPLGPLVMPSGPPFWGKTPLFQSEPRVSTTAWELDYTDAVFTQNANTVNIYVAQLPQRATVLRCFAEVITPFAASGLTVCNVQVGTDLTASQYLLSFSALSAAVKGMVDGDMGTGLARATAVQGGDPSEWNATGHYIKVTMGPNTGSTFGNGTVTNLTAGKIRIYVTTEMVGYV